GRTDSREQEVLGVETFQLRLQHGQAARQVQLETRRGRFKFEIVELEVRLNVSIRDQLRPIQTQELRHATARNAQRAGEDVGEAPGNGDRLKDRAFLGAPNSASARFFNGRRRCRAGDRRSE